MNLIGAGEPALPGISIGHNGTAAFGLTRFYIDQEDLYVYELNPNNAREYRYKDAWEPMRVERETVRVKGGAAVEVELSFTRHGPVLHADPRNRRAYAVRSCWLEPGTAAYFGSASYAFARDVQEFRSGIARAGAPGLNYVYADVKGNFGWFVGGRAPVRPNWDGLVPVPGDGRYEWGGFLAGDQLPSNYNPASGYFSTSNEMNVPADYPWRERKLGFEWANGSPHARIEEVLQALPKVSIEDSMRLQNDITSVAARRLVAVLGRLQAADANSKRALELLRGWDGVERADSAQAALLEVWIARHLGRAFLEAALPKTAADAIRTADMTTMLEALEKPGTDRLLLGSLAAAWAEMEKLQGPDPKRWQWGKLHQALPAHPLRDMVDAETRAKLQPGPFPKAGGPFTPNQSAYRVSDFQLTNGPSFRVVVDVGNWDNSRAVNYPGQSGNPDDPHYRDLTGMWLRGDYFPLLYTRAAVEKATDKKILLRPVR
jgi:penicillin amidase